jgi:hypothetical protein
LRVLPFSPFADFPWPESLGQIFLRSNGGEEDPWEDQRALLIYPAAPVSNEIYSPKSRIIWYHCLTFQDQVIYPEIFSPHPYEESVLNLPQVPSQRFWNQEWFNRKDSRGKKPQLHHWAVLGVPGDWPLSQVIEGLYPLQEILPTESAPLWLPILDRWLQELSSRLRLTETMKEEALGAARSFLIRGGKVLPTIPQGAGSKELNKALFKEIMEALYAY